MSAVSVALLVTRPRFATTTTIAAAVLALAVGGCGDDDEPTAATTAPGAQTAPAPTATTGTTITPVTTSTNGGKGDAARTEALGGYTLAINDILRQAAEYAVAVQGCAKGEASKGRSCVDEAVEKLESAEDKYKKATETLRKGASDACAKGLDKAEGAIEKLVDVLDGIGDAAATGDVERFNAEAKKMGTTLQGQSTDLVAGQAACSS